MCHTFLSDPKLYNFLFQVDQEIANEVQAAGCPHCGGKLHSACYPRKPRGIRGTLGKTYTFRFSFCCASRECRRRTTPPSIRFLGRKVYLGVMVVLISAMKHGLSPKRRQWLIDTLNVPAQTVWRWRSFWQTTFAISPFWQMARAHFLPPIPSLSLPGGLLGRLQGAGLAQRLGRLLHLIAPITTTSWSSSLLPLRAAT